MLKQVGKTTDGKIIVSGVFKLYETEGLPLDVLLQSLQDNNAVPDWLWFFIEATEAGMKPDRIISKLSTAISDSYGADFRDVVIKKLNCFYTNFEKREKHQKEALDELISLSEEMGLYDE